MCLRAIVRPPSPIHSAHAATVAGLLSTRVGRFPLISSPASVRVGGHHYVQVFPRIRARHEDRYGASSFNLSRVLTFAPLPFPRSFVANLSYRPSLSPVGDWCCQCTRYRIHPNVTPKRFSSTYQLPRANTHAHSATAPTLLSTRTTHRRHTIGR